MMHFRTEYDCIPMSEYSKLQQWLLKTGIKAHKDARDYLSKLDGDTNNSTPASEPVVEISYTSFGYVKVPEIKAVARARKPGRKKRT